MPDYHAVARRAAQRYGLDPDVFVRQIQQESGFQTGRSSGAGAQGIAQIMPETAAGWHVDPNDPVAALNAAAKHMAGYVKQFGNYADALRAYNAGPGRVAASHGFAETNNYVKTILGGKTPSASGADPGGSDTSSPTALALTKATGGAPLASIALNPRGARQITAPTPADPSAQPALPGAPRSDLPVRFDAGQALDAIEKLHQAKQAQTEVVGGGSADGAATVPTNDGGGRGSEVLELIHNDGGKGYGIKNGQIVDAPSVYSGVWAGHANHVHVAAGPKTVVALGKLAESMGLRVGENPHFGGVDPGAHVAGSYHNKGEAIDVSGNAAKMNAFSQAVERYNRTRRLPSF